MGLIGHTEECIGSVREHSDTAILFCSLGKDSLVVLDLIAPKFRHVICVFMYFVPGLEHIEKYIRWAEGRYPNTVFVQVPHWSLTRIMRCGLYCVPNPKMRLLSLKDIDANMKLKYGIEYSFYGMKKADSLNRRLMLDGYAANHYINNGKAYPLAEWTQKDVLSYMRQHRLPQPVRYSRNASGGVGFNEDCYVWMREHYPQDLAKVLKAFPMSEKILYDHDNRQEENNGS
ncbi:MAG: phosphoadenosine phosphosulfate reductase family protein [Bacteroidales bacterium]|jgi:sulfate adenylyltransferase subunit 2|nr:phosphoadenosine phosphosulfate reductase family protein [Bacteroidales bacterium]